MKNAPKTKKNAQITQNTTRREQLPKQQQPDDQNNPSRAHMRMCILHLSKQCDNVRTRLDSRYALNPSYANMAEHPSPP